MRAVVRGMRGKVLVRWRGQGQSGSFPVTGIGSPSLSLWRIRGGEEKKGSLGPVLASVSEPSLSGNPHEHQGEVSTSASTSASTSGKEGPGQQIPGLPELPDCIEVEYLQKYRKNVGLCVLDERTGLVFAARRVDDDSRAWQMPQGGIDRGEDPRLAALRELEEETGIKPGRVEFVAEVDEWLAYDFPTSVKERIATAYVKRVVAKKGVTTVTKEERKRFKKKVFKGQKQKWFLLRFTGDASDIDLAARGEENREFSEWCWMPLSEMPHQVVHFKKEVYEQVSLHFCPIIESF
ncbi:RNA pyrophosphohydrolase [Chloropicon primus]|uniref:RNA pyrophosphohydrolase n=1 Tax=Chloropicon primus TaxID=1764295 RepID=A0A5B8N348_9CHLO|nr:RNA pyrophosphohydrolase [Chloropicon primus]|eukprot:QDZ26114.1 RNA pyrophosphohydrolase [Chloropicon primus]